MAAGTPTVLTIVLIEDSTLLRQALGKVLDDLDGVEVVGDAGDEHSAIDLLQRRRPHLAIVDLQLRVGSGIGVLQALSQSPERFGRPRAIVFSNYGHADVRARCLALGVDRFFDKATEIDALLNYVRQAAID